MTLPVGFVSGSRTINGTRVGYDVRQSDQPALVFVPGWCCPRSDWYAIAAALPQWSILIADLPAPAASVGAPSMTELGELIAELAAGFGWAELVPIGHSMGGAVAVETAIALKGRVCQVVGVDTLTYESFYARQDEAFISAALAPYEADFRAAMHKLVEALFISKDDPGLIEQIATTMASYPQAESLIGMRTLLEWDRDAALDRCHARIKVISAAAFLDPAVTAKLADRVQITPVELGGHFFLLERPGETAEEIRKIVTAGRQEGMAAATRG